MEMHLFNSAKSLRMERAYKAFFIDLKIPMHLLTTDKLDEKGAKHVGLLFRNFKLHNKDTLSLCPADPTRLRSSTCSPQNHAIDLADNQSPFDLAKGESGSLSNSVAPSVVSSPQPGGREWRCCQMDYSLYDVEAAVVDGFPSVNRFTLHYHANGDLDVAPQADPDAPAVDVFLMLALKKIAVVDPTHREALSDAVVKAIIARLRSAFHAPLQRILHTSALKLNGPLIFAAVNRSLSTAFSVRTSVDSGDQPGAAYYRRSLDQLASLLPAGHALLCLRRRLPQLVDLQPPATGPRLLVLKTGDYDLVFQMRNDHLADVFVYPVDDKPPVDAEVMGLLAKAFNLLMASLWTDLN
jgi:hypothetical protein